MSGGASVTKSDSSSKQGSDSRARFPTEFLRDFQNLFGAGIGINELLGGGIPTTVGLFGDPNQRIGVQANDPSQFEQSARSTTNTGSFANFVPATPGSNGSGTIASGGEFPQLPPPAPVPTKEQSASGFFDIFRPDKNPASPFKKDDGPSKNDIENQIFSQQFSKDPFRFNLADIAAPIADAMGPIKKGDTNHALQGLAKGFESIGVDPNNGYTLGEFQRAAQAGPMKNNERQVLLGAVAAQMQAKLDIAGQTENIPRFTTTGAQSGFDARPGAASVLDRQLNPIQADVGKAVGFNKDPNQVALNAAQAGQANIAGGDFNAFQNSLFEGQFRPVQREIERQGALEDRALSSQLAGAGLASSGTGIGQQQQQLTQRQDRLTDAARDAATQASIQSLGVKFEQEFNNANNRQATNLANAGFDLDAQKANAQNVLLGGAQKSKAYLDAIGLNVKSAQDATNSFLDMLGIQEQDLARQDSFAIGSLSGIIDTWLRTLGAVTSAGGVSTSQGQSQSSSFGVGVSGGVSGA